MAAGGAKAVEILAPRPTQGELNRRDRIGLRAMVQEQVHHFTMLRRRELYDEFVVREGRPPTESEMDRMQPLIEEFDPVVELSLIAADYRNDPAIRRQASSDAAQYLRPKLSAVAMLDDPNRLAQESEKRKLAARLVDLLQLVSVAKTSAGASVQESQKSAEGAGGESH